MAQIIISQLPPLPNGTGSGTPKGTDLTPATDTTDTSSAATGTTKKYTRSAELNYYMHAQGLTVYTAVRVASTTAFTVTYANGALGVGATLTNAGAQAALSIDGVSVAVGDRVLVKNQVTTFQNGIYTVTTVGSGSTNWVMTRATDYDQAAEVIQYGIVVVNQGIVNTGLLYQETGAGPFTMGTTPITFAAYTAQSLALPVSLAQGGTGAALTASNGGIFYSNATTGAILSGTATANQVLLSGSSSAPAWSTATYPATTTINQLLYSSSANVIGGVAAVVGGVLVSNSSSVPSFLANPTATGRFLQSVSGDAAIWSTAAFPTSVGAVGTILRSDGTNWAATTTTYPATNAVSTLLYASSANVMAALATANNGILVTSAGGVPSIGNTVGADLVINTVRVGLGAGSVATNTVAAVSGLALNTTGARSTGVGYLALSSQTTATDNTAFGANCLKACDGSNNTAIGSYAGSVVSSGIYNCAGGYASLSTLTTSSFNTAFGGNSLAANTASANCAFGYASMSSNTSGVRNTGIGYATLQSNLTSIDNTAVGYNALNLVTNAGNTAVGSLCMDVATTATANNAFGVNCMGALTTGASNNAFGAAALGSITTASELVALGDFALAFNTTGLRNTAVGTSSQKNATTATDNTSLGYNTFQAATFNGSFNTAVGAGACTTMTSGSQNCAFGDIALYTNATGTNNCAFGVQSLYLATGGSNSAYGWSSLLTLSTGSFNSALGSSCLLALTTGSNNVGIGTGAGNTGTVLTTGSSNTLLGFQSQVNNAAATGVIAIGANAIADIATGVTNADNGPGIAIGAAGTIVGFRGDGTLYPTAGAGGGVALPLASGFLRVKVNGTYYKIALTPDA